MNQIMSIVKQIQNKAEIHWTHVFANNLSIQLRLFITITLVSLGIILTYVLHRMTGHFFASIDMLIVIFIAIYAGPISGILSGISMTVIEDLLFIGDIDKILNNSESVERFFVLCTLTLVISLLTSSIKTGYGKTIAAKKEAEIATRAKSAFLATVSHEIRTPLNGIIGLSDVLRESNLSDEDKKYINIIHDSGKTLLNIINDILDYSKTESGKVSLEMSQFSLRDIMNQIIMTLSSRAASKSINLVSIIDPNLPQFVVGDSSRLMQVLFNLLGNSIKFTAVGSVILRLKQVHTESKNKVRIQFSIVDTGHGISEEDQKYLFQPFTQLHKPGTSGEPGTGLGLSICREILNAMGSEIYLESQVDRGSRFYFDIEFANSSNEKVESILIKSNTVNERNSGFIENIFNDQDQPSILVTEDNLTNQITAKIMLERLGVNVTIAMNGREALELISKKNFDLVLMDCQMPIMDGFEATAEIRKIKFNTPIIAMTANAFKEDQNACMNAGMNGFISKPLTYEALIATMLPFLKPEPPFVSLQILDTLEKAVGSSGMVKIVVAFLSGTNELNVKLRKTVVEQNLEGLHSIAHRFKSAASTVGAQGLAFLLKKLEKTNNIKDASLIASQIEKAVGEVILTLNKHISQYGENSTLNPYNHELTLRS